MDIREVRLEPYRAEHAERMVEAARESFAEVQPWLPWCHPKYSLSEAQTWIEAQIATYQAGTAYEFVIEADDGRYLGGCGVNQLDPVHRRANLGYWVRTSATGRGVGTRAVRLAHNWAFASTDLIRLEILSAVENHPSIRVAEKAGAVREGILRRRLVAHGKAHDAVVFSLTRAME